MTDGPIPSFSHHAHRQRAGQGQGPPPFATVVTSKKSEARKACRAVWRAVNILFCAPTAMPSYPSKPTQQSSIHAHTPYQKKPRGRRERELYPHARKKCVVPNVHESLFVFIHSPPLKPTFIEKEAAAEAPPAVTALWPPSTVPNPAFPLPETRGASTQTHPTTGPWTPGRHKSHGRRSM